MLPHLPRFAIILVLALVRHQALPLLQLDIVIVIFVLSIRLFD